MNLQALRTLGALVAVCLLAGTTAAIPVNIDTFDLCATQASVFGTGTSSGTDNVGDATQTIGGYRGYTIVGQGPGVGVTALAVMAGRAGLGTLTMASPYTGQWTLRYGTISDLHADLVGTGGVPNTGILIQMIKAEYDYDLDLTVVSHSTSTLVHVVQPASQYPHNVFVPFGSFSGVDFQDIDRIIVQLTGQPDGDYTIDAISANVPEPATMTLLAAGGLLALRRRYR